jgi:thiamine biosynthesis lipoprotein
VAAILDLKLHAMASGVQAILVEPAGDAEAFVRARLAELEQRWSRFLPGSDISKLNSAPEAIVRVSSDTIALVVAMKEAARVTDGRYDPTMLSAINAAGYSRSIEGSRRSSRLAGRPGKGRGIEDVAIDVRLSAVVVPAGVGLDPGGIGKGLAADMIVGELLERGTAGALLSIGGDIAAAGTPPAGDGWHVAVEDPFDRSRQLTLLAFNAGGVATSSTLSRAWYQAGQRRHHVIDPQTRTCSTTDLAAATVVARAGWEAEAHATAALLSGSGRVLEYFDRHAIDGLAVPLAGMLRSSAALSRAGVSERSWI